jgi:hypothetical protein
VENKGTIIKDFSHLMRFKKIFGRYAVLSITMIVAMLFILVGIALFIESLLTLPPGLVYVAMGTILMIVALICKKIWRV